MSAPDADGLVGPSGQPATRQESIAEVERKRAAGRLPYDILLQIFLEAVEMDPIEGKHGGKLRSWDDTRSLRYMPLISKEYEPAATAALYRSVCLHGGDEARLFAQTLRIRPSRAPLVHYLVLSVGPDREELDDATGLAEDSQDLVRVLALLPNVRHLHLRPLHHSIRRTLFTALTSKNLLTLICAPRLYLNEGGWAAGLYEAYDVEMFRSTLETIELDYVVPEQPSSASLGYLPAPSQFIMSTLALRQIRLHVDLSDRVLWSVLSNAPHLTVCDIYVEHTLSRSETVAALSASTARMKHMRFVCNPTSEQLELLDVTDVPVFDYLLPFYSQLKHLTVSATEISSELFRIGLPPKLLSLTIQAFNHKAMFVYSDRLVESLLDPRTNVGNLKTLAVFDQAEAWSNYQAAKMHEACQARGIRFHFFPDSEESSE